MPSLQSYPLRLLCHATKLYLSPASGIRPHHITRLRQMMDSFGKWFHDPRGTHIEKLRIDNNLEVGWFHVGDTVPTQRTVLFIHGGAFFLGSLLSHQSLIARISEVAEARTLAVDYRLAPENPFPAGLDDCLTAYHWLVNDQHIPPEQIAVVGDSSGANMLLGMLLKLRDAGEKLPAAAVCMSPPTELAWRGESFFVNARRDPILALDLVLFAADAYLYGPLVPGATECEIPPAQKILSSQVSPLYGELSGLPPLLIQVGTDEILLSSARCFSNKATAAGVEVKHHEFKGMWHVFQFFWYTLPEARQAVNEIGAFIKEHAGV